MFLLAELTKEITVVCATFLSTIYFFLSTLLLWLLPSHLSLHVRTFACIYKGVL